MPLGLAPADRKLLLVCGVLLVLMLAVSILLAPPQEQGGSLFPSTYSSQTGGARAAYLLLQRLNYPVRRWEAPPTELPFWRANRAVLILAEPTEFPSDKERKAIQDFVRNGGRLLFTGPNLQLFFPDADIPSVPPDPKDTEFTPDLPAQMSEGARRITIRPRAYWGRVNESQLVLYGQAASRAVVAWRYGEGEIEWWAGSTPLSNSGISKTDNLQFFLDAVANPAGEGAYQIYWDEYFHGQRDSLLSYARKPALLMGLAQTGVLLAAVLFTFSRRSGPVYIPAAVSRLSPLEFVDTLGGLYQRAHAGAAAVSVSYSRLRFLLVRQLGLPAGISDAELARMAEERLGWKGFQQSGLLERASAARREVKLRDKSALELVQELERHSAKLGISAEFSRGKG